MRTRFILVALLGVSLNCWAEDDHTEVRHQSIPIGDDSLHCANRRPWETYLYLDWEGEDRREEFRAVAGSMEECKSSKEQIEKEARSKGGHIFRNISIYQKHVYDWSLDKWCYRWRVISREIISKKGEPKFWAREEVTPDPNQAVDMKLCGGFPPGDL